MTTRVHTIACKMLAIVAILLIGQRAALAEWEITQFEIVQDFPDWNEVYLETTTFAKDPNVPSLDPFALEAGRGAASHKISGSNLGLVSYFLNQIAEKYSVYDLPEPTNLQKSKDGKRYKIYFYDFAKSSYDMRALDNNVETIGGRLNTNCVPTGPNHKPSWLAFNTPRVIPTASENIGHYAQGLYDTLAHELFHAIQNAALYSEVKTYCGKSDVYGEGTATAVGSYMANQIYTNYFASKPRVEVSKQGKFNFYNSWLDAQRALGGPDRSNDVYTANPVFRYAMERYDGKRGEFGGLKIAKLYVEDLNKIRPENPNKIEIDQWLNERLAAANEYLPLPIYFAEMLAHHADSADRYKVQEQPWVDALFGQCVPVQIRKGELWKPKDTLTLWDNAALCFDVTVVGLKKNECLYVNLMLETISDYGPLGDSKVSGLDRLHLSSPKMGGVLIDDENQREYDCYKNSLRGEKPMCVFAKPLNGKFDGPRERYTRAWFTPQQWSAGGSLSNRYILSAARHTDYKAKKNGQNLNLSIGAQQAGLKHGGKDTKCPGSGVDSTLGGTLPHAVTGGVPGTNGLPTAMFPFLVGVPNIDIVDPVREGISTILLSEYGDNTPESEMAGKYQFQFSTDEPIPFGAKGTYPAAIFGTMLGDPPAFVRDAGGSASGIIDVLRFDDEMLYVKVSGKYCVITAENPQCTGNYPVSGEVVRPFGWTYDRAQKPFVISTPGMQHYARLFGDILPGVDNKRSSSLPGDGSGADTSSSSSGTGGSSRSGGGSSGCDCSCEEHARLGKEAEAFENGGPMPEKLMQCAMQCLVAYLSCEGSYE